MQLTYFSGAPPLRSAKTDVLSEISGFADVVKTVSFDLYKADKTGDSYEGSIMSSDCFSHEYKSIAKTAIIPVIWIKFLVFRVLNLFTEFG